MPVLPAHVPVAALTRDERVEGVHYGSVAVTGTDGALLSGAGDPGAPFYPRSALKPFQAVAMVLAGLQLPAPLMALAAASHSGGAEHRAGTQEILRLHGLTADALANTVDLPYGGPEREAWLREGGVADRVCQNCSGKHAAMVGTCTLNGWPVEGYLNPAHPMQQLVMRTVAALTGEEPAQWSTDGCGTPLPALSLTAMARGYGRMARLAAAPETAEDDVERAAAVVARAMMQHPEMVAGEGRDVTALMRALPGALAKDGFEGVQLIGLPDGSAVAVKISDGGDRARMPVAVQALQTLGVDTEPLSAIASSPVLGGGVVRGSLDALPSVLASAQQR
ncbi:MULTISPECIES: asparaginase [Arthrobacter]|uniref:Asparaginase n=2 Tax=Arthrobacter TaxID=1663 RepID=A0ABU9KLE6_9MICC|nr:asparaginase [Arthrobacter sp. YJM1]MDP5227385.1 asparaginase [Arthrobacter sp. YJM1]